MVEIGYKAYSTQAGLSSGVQNAEIDFSEINIKRVSHLNNLILAYESIKSNPGNMTPGSNKETLDGVSMDYLKKLQQELLSGKFKFSPGRRVEIPKANKNETRPLTIASPREKIVQKALQIVLNAYYDPIFSPNSYGFRPNTSIAHAIHRIDSDFQSAK